MRNLKITLLAASAVAAVAAPAAQAQVAFPAADVHGAGASSITNVLVTSMNCIGNPGNHVAGDTTNNRLNKSGTNTGSLSTVAPGNYVGIGGTDPNFSCETQEIQPDFQGKYVATGSGLGRTWWSSFANQLPGSGSSDINPFGAWTNLQFAFSDSPVSASDLTAYNAGANNATNKAGAAIQFPLYVLPVAVAYVPTYGQNGATSLNFNVKSTYVAKDAAGNPVGGLRLSKAGYCKIFNGEITNWNDAALQTLNGGQSLMDAADSSSRWTSEGVPMRLVGRVDKSGTTDIFTRHLAAVCTGLVTTNKFANAAETLPFDPTSSIDMRGFRSDSNLFPGVSSSKLAGTNQSISGAFFNKTTQAIVTTQGSEAAGKFMVADGSSGVRDAIKFAPDRASTVTPGLLLNGKIGYIGADFVKPAAGAVLFSAALQVGTSTTYAIPNAKNAVAAFGKAATLILPPQSGAKGEFNVNDARTNSVTGAKVDRSNPLDWTDVLYSGANKLSNPSAGYPITGTTQYLGYTCYVSAANRLAMENLIATHIGKLKKDSTGALISGKILISTGAATPGIMSQLGISPLPASWMGAIYETFLKKSAQTSIDASTSLTVKLSDKQLYLQTKMPTKASDLTANIGNPTCTPGAGA